MGLGVKRVNRVSRWPFVIRGQKSSNRITPGPPGEGIGGEGETSAELDAEVTKVVTAPTARFDVQCSTLTPALSQRERVVDMRPSNACRRWAGHV